MEFQHTSVHAHVLQHTHTHAYKQTLGTLPVKQKPQTLVTPVLNIYMLWQERKHYTHSGWDAIL